MASAWIQHLPILPVIIPMAAGAAMLLLKDADRVARMGLATASALAQAAVAAALLHLTAGAGSAHWAHDIGVYLLGDWRAPFGIVVVVDRLAAIMLALNAVLGLCALVYASAHWDRAGSHFHPLFQFLMMGLNGAFLTGDLFNLFVFFEVLLAASYGLLLHGSGRARVAAGLHYVAVNLVASFLLLIAIALIYGATGTLNMADLALRAGRLAGSDRLVFEAGAAILGVAFLIKAAAWPLNFWLPSTYASASAPVGAVFAIMTKVGIYALLRLGLLLPSTATPLAFGGDWIFLIGLAPLAFGTLGLLTAQQANRLAAYCVIMSSGTLLAALGAPGAALTSPLLFYLISSVLATGAFFMLVDMIERTQAFGAGVLAVSQDALDLDDPESPDASDDVVGVSIPAAMAFLGLAFVSCAILIAGLPPLSGFVAKFALFSALLQVPDGQSPSWQAWLLLIAVLASGMACVMAMSRTGIRAFWSNEGLVTPRLRVVEAAPVAALLLLCVALAARAGPVMTYLDETAQSLSRPAAYIDAVLSQAALRDAIAPGATP